MKVRTSLNYNHPFHCFVLMRVKPDSLNYNHPFYFFVLMKVRPDSLNYNHPFHCFFLTVQTAFAIYYLLITSYNTKYFFIFNSPLTLETVNEIQDCWKWINGLFPLKLTYNPCLSMWFCLIRLKLEKELNFYLRQIH